MGGRVKKLTKYVGLAMLCCRACRLDRQPGRSRDVWDRRVAFRLGCKDPSERGSECSCLMLEQVGRGCGTLRTGDRLAMSSLRVGKGWALTERAQ